MLAATQRNHVDIARLLINEGADVNVKDYVQDTPFLYAGAEGRVEILKMMLAAGADLTSVNRSAARRSFRPVITVTSKR